MKEKGQKENDGYEMKKSNKRPHPNPMCFG
jgi:hypothetical protein